MLLESPLKWPHVSYFEGGKLSLFLWKKGLHGALTISNVINENLQEYSIKN